MPIPQYVKNLRAKVGNETLMMPAICAIVVNSRGQVLLQRAREDGLWHTLGGCLDPGENPGDTVVREMMEETGLLVRPLRITGVYADPLITYSNGDRVYYTVTCFLCRVIGDETPTIGDDESLELRYFDPHNLPALPDFQSIKLQHALNNGEQPYFKLSEPPAEPK
jgi:8-oxo-dGTP pyrophosphatase MutT (NUDIX family)